MPTPEQLKAYADRLPTIYRDIIEAFHDAVAPYRKYGEGLSLDVLLIQLANSGHEYVVSEVYAALEQLDRLGFFDWETDQSPRVAPTPLGEKLIEAVTGRRISRVSVPDLPKPTW